MLTKRNDSDHYTEIAVWNEGDQPAYRIICMDIDIDRETGMRMPPTAQISLLATTQADYASARRLAAEYTYVADIAEALQAEKRAAYEARYS
jgi:hypothetical protein